MRFDTRRTVNVYFTLLGLFSILFMAASLIVILGPIFAKGATAFVFRGTVEYRQMRLEEFDRGDRETVEAEMAEARAAREPVYEMLETFRADLREMSMGDRMEYKPLLGEVEDLLRKLLGPLPGEDEPVLVVQRYGQTRWDRTLVHLEQLLYVEEYDYSDPTQMGRKILVPRARQFEGTSLEPMFGYVEEHLGAMLRPRWTFYWRFLLDKSKGSHFFGGIWPELLGTIYLTLGTMLFAVPMGVIAAIYFVEYAGEGRLVGFLRVCVSTLAGVPSIVFGLFGLAFFINSLHVSPGKSVLAGSLTLGLLVLPTIIRASEEALRAVPQTYKEAALSVGATKWHTIVTVIMPAALPGILTSIVISMGRAAGETAPIIFTAAVSFGAVPAIHEVLSEPTPALPWNIYNLCTEHEGVDEIRHVQFGMAMTLVMAVLLLNGVAIFLRARIANKLRG